MCAGVYVDFVRVASVAALHVLVLAHAGSGHGDVHLPSSPAPFPGGYSHTTEQIYRYRYTYKVLLPSLKARRDIRPMVEVGPGFFKSAILSIPGDYQLNEFKKLLALKKKRDEKNKT